MNRIVAFLRALTRHPKTSAAGLAVVAGVIIRAIHTPEILADPTVWIALLSAIGLLLAADGRDDDDRRGGPPRTPAGFGGRGVGKVVEFPAPEGSRRRQCA